MKKNELFTRGTYVVIILLSCFLMGTVLLNYADQQERKRQEQLEKNWESAVNREYAIRDLTELRGRTITINRLYLYGNSENETDLRQELYVIISATVVIKESKNSCLKNFKFIIPKDIETSDIGEICEEVLSQIDGQLDYLRANR